MYYPYLRGRQYELLAVRELLEKELISEKVVPIIEPIRETTTLKTTLTVYAENNRKIYTIINPQVGDYKLYAENHPITNQLLDMTYDAVLMNDATSIIQCRDVLARSEDFITIYLSRDDLSNRDLLAEKGLVAAINFTKDGSRYKRLFRNDNQRIGLIRDAFEKQSRNADYAAVVDEFFSDDHLFFDEEDYDAFSDYSIVGEHYTDGGFAPIAVAIHIVYFDSEDVLRIKHFVSKSNEDITNPAGKFAEALDKLVEWASSIENKNESYAINQFRQMKEEKRYPGLGFVKKLSIMHHLEIMSNYLSGR